LTNSLAKAGVEGFGGGSPSLWRRLSMINPWVFYRLEDYYTVFAEVLKNNQAQISPKIRAIIKTEFKDDFDLYVSHYKESCTKVSKTIKTIQDKQKR
jgi:hypothetical protein